MATMQTAVNSSFNNETKITKHIWRIDEHNTEKFKVLPSGSHVQSNVFTTNEFMNIKWYLRGYPNGTNKNSIGSCKMFLRLKSLAKEYKSIKVYYYIRCLQTNSCIECVNAFTKYNDFSGWNSRTQLTSELNKSNINHIIFETGIRILKITDINNKIVYNYSLPVSCIKKQYKITWHINDNLLNAFKNSQYGKWINATLLSNTNHMFSIACCPNGEKQKDKGHFSLFFVIVSFPTNIESMKVKFSLQCSKLNKYKTRTYIFSDATSSRGWPRFCTTNELKANRINCMDIICIVNIMEMYDKNGNNIAIENNNEIIDMSDEKKENMNNYKYKPNEIKVKSTKYNDEIINQLVNLGIGTREECIAASYLVINSNDINEVKDKVYEIQYNATLKSPTTIIESISSTRNNPTKRKYNPRQSIAEPWSPMLSPVSPISPSNITAINNKIRSNINCVFDKETKIFKYTWTIHENDVQKFKDLSMGCYAQSNQFMSETDKVTNIKWILRCYPNGMNIGSTGSCKMYLCLSSFGDMINTANNYKNNIGCMVIYYYIRCIQTHTCTEFIREFTKCGDNSGWKTRRQLSVELNKTNIHRITFETCIRILSITDINNNIIYRYPLRVSSIKKQYQLTWHIDNELLNVCKTAHCAKSIDATLISNKNQMFSIQLYPNGYDEIYKGYLSLYFIVVSFPIGVQAMKVKFKIKCAKLTYIKQYVFSQQKYGRGWDKFCVAKSTYLNMKSLNITCEVEIVQLYDKSGKIIEFDVKNGVNEKKESNSNIINIQKYEDQIANLQKELYTYKKLVLTKSDTIQSLQNTVGKHLNDKKTMQKRFDEISQANVRQRSTIQRRKTLTDSHHHLNAQLRAQISVKDDEIKQLKSKNGYLNKRISYKSINEQKEENKNEKNLSKILTDLNSDIKSFKQNYNQKICKEICDKSLSNIIENGTEINKNINDYNHNIGSVISSFEILQKYTKNMQNIMKTVSVPNINAYKTWNLQQIIAWIISLDNGKYIKYIPKLCKGFKDSDIKNGSVLPELTRTDLSNPPFNINEFIIKRDLEKYFKSLSVCNNVD